MKNQIAFMLFIGLLFTFFILGDEMKASLFQFGIKACF